MAFVGFDDGLGGRRSGPFLNISGRGGGQASGGRNAAYWQMAAGGFTSIQGEEVGNYAVGEWKNYADFLRLL